MGFDRKHLNGELFPFLEFNRQRYPELTMQDYLDLEGLMFRLNAQAVRGTSDAGRDSRVSHALRRTLNVNRQASNP